MGTLLPAFPSLFEKGFSLKFSELFSEMDHQLTFTQLPTRSHRNSRDSILGVDRHQSESSAHQKSPEFVVDQFL